MIKRLRQNRKVLGLLAGAVALGLILGIMADVIRLGPSEVALPANPMIVALEILRVRDGDDQHDYYVIVVTIHNQVNDPSIQPYEATVTLENNAPDNVGHLPQNGEDADQPWDLSYRDVVDRTFPAGSVSYREGTPATGHWTVRGESLLKSRPIFRGEASFLLEIRTGEGSAISASTTVSVTWYYHSAVQAYPVASRTITTSARSSPVAGLPFD